MSRMRGFPRREMAPALDSLALPDQAAGESESSAAGPLVRLDEITKLFPAVRANDRVSMVVNAGEVVGLLGENGAGKTTLVRILAGLETPDSGSIFIRGRLTPIGSPARARELGIAMVHQHSSLVPRMSVLENLILGERTAKLSRVDLAAYRAQFSSCSESYGLDVDLASRVADLSVGQQQRVEILRALIAEPAVLILDEPTGVLSMSEAERLFTLTRRLARDGSGVVLISHKLDELLTHTDRIVVMRKGGVAARLETADADKAMLARLMIDDANGRGERSRLPDAKQRMGTSAEETSPGERDAHSALQAALGSAEESRERSDADASQEKQGSVSLALKNVTYVDESGRPRLSDISFEVVPGSIVGVAGIEGNGQRYLVDVVSGVLTPSSGVVRVQDVDATAMHVADRLDLGLAVIHEDRQLVGGILAMNVAENMVLGRRHRRRFQQSGLIRWREARDFSREMAEVYRIDGTPDTKYGTLSGGNQQRTILARELSAEPEVLVAEQPTRGLDLRSIAFVWQQLGAVRARGGAVLVISSDLDEILQLSDTVIVLHRGRLVGQVVAADTDKRELAEFMTGSRE